MRGAALAAALLAGFVGTHLSAAAPVEVHPAGAAVPENLLRIELRFDRPQRLPFDVARVSLLDSTGWPIADAFLDMTLPSADGLRITLLMDPGRVKTEVGPNLALGRALHAGSAVRLVVDGVVKDWQVAPFQSQGPQPTRWRLEPPRAHTRDALVVSLNEAISSPAESLIAVRDGAGRRVAGRTRLSRGDTVWAFVPEQPWQGGPHAVVAHPDLEDPAGNRACAAFEQALASAIRCVDEAAIRFETRASAPAR